MSVRAGLLGGGTQKKPADINGTSPPSITASGAMKFYRAKQ